ncbi:hypothetical protein M0805_000936 [Coniferiporia weirii]|nr:hypothetical protein M0805_000936 [Coniferiporia weirii]
MSLNKKKLLSRVNTLSSSLDELEAKLEPLFSQPLAETTASLDVLQQAKIHVVLPYLINDLIFIYLRTRGVDPKTHPVVAELDRVRNYFAKIQGAEDVGKRKTSGIDRAAAERFIKHAIAQVKQSATATEVGAGPSQPPVSTFMPIRVTEKMREREEYQRELANVSDSEEAVLEIIDDDESKHLGIKGKGVARAPPEEVQELLDSIGTNFEVQKKKRPRTMDSSGSLIGETGSAAGSNPGKIKRKSKKLIAVIDDDASSSRASSVTSVEIGSGKKRRKKTATAS